MHKNLRKKLSKSVQYLIGRKVKINNPAILTAVKTEVKRAKMNITPNSQNDKLMNRLINFGNGGEFFRAEIQKLENLLNEPKTPVTEHLGSWRSIEFEMIFNSGEAFERFKKAARKPKFAKAISIHHDGSIKPEKAGQKGVEIVFMYRTGEEDSVREVCKLFNEYGYVNSTCGTHVHFDTRHVQDSTQVKEIGNRMAPWIDALFTILPPSRKDSKYCQPRVSPINGSHEDRYCFVNLTAYRKYQTVEIRAHHGTINADKILNWIKICETIMNNKYVSAVDVKGKYNLENLIKHYNFDENLSKFIKERYEFFKNNEYDEEWVRDSKKPQPIMIPITVNTAVG